MGASNWYLFFGAVLCCTGIGLPVGIFMFLYWFYKDFMDRGVTVNHKNESTTLPIDSILGKDYQERESRIDEISNELKQEKSNYSFKGNIGDLRNKEEYT